MLACVPRCALIALFFVAAVPDSASAEPIQDSPLIDKDGLLPPDHSPASVPAANGGAPVTATSLRKETREAILLFDAAKESRRHYDLVNCLDGLTFGFGNWPQAKFGEVLAEVRANRSAQEAFIQRAVETFDTNSRAWSAFRDATGTRDEKPTKSAVAQGFEKLFPKGGRGNVKIKAARDDTCRPRPRAGISYYQDHQLWLVPTLKRAFRDPAVVATQVEKWERDVLNPAAHDASALGIDGAGVYLLAFYRSNPGQIPGLKAAIAARKPPSMILAAGREWAWKTPPRHLAGAQTQDWQMLLLWQAMCPRPGPKFRIRNRNIAFFNIYLAKTFTARKPELQNNKIVVNEMCDPEKVTLIAGRR